MAIFCSLAQAGSQEIISSHSGKPGQGTLRLRAFVKPQATVRLSSSGDFKANERRLQTESSGSLPWVFLSGPGTNTTPWLVSVEHSVINEPFAANSQTLYTVSPF